jgi:hypothetical protein
LKPEWWGSPLAQEQKYQGRKKTCDKNDNGDDDEVNNNDNNNANKQYICSQRHELHMSLDTEGFGGYKEINFEEERSRRGTV